ncbi:DUF1440 domain-containing protein [Hymenobacter sp. BT491]|uniref:DUF1440 domain-containing protein n=1 Tax=Hymenobacter sp. BT491 TaxID=2766779 RepID=UPI001CA3B979|nr:DUF1440 domain-containing protein [Hymenobacter sp. BT491]
MSYSMPASAPTVRLGRTRAVVLTALVAGTLDISVAMTKYALTTGRDPLGVPRYVASGLLGKEALTGGLAAAGWGFVFHYGFAFLFTAFYFWLFPRLGQRWSHPVVRGVLYGSFVWLVMNLVVVPASRIGRLPSDPAKAALEWLIILVCIGLPIAIGAARYYRSAK